MILEILEKIFHLSDFNFYTILILYWSKDSFIYFASLAQYNRPHT